MPSDKNPVFRKAIIPWYHSKTAYFFAVFSMLLVFLFGLAGISVAREIEKFKVYIWVPILLVVLSGALIITITTRLIRRYASK
jgi:hypothetical protein